MGAELTVTGNVADADVPQLLIAATEMLPPAVPVVTEMLLPEDVPDQPAGKVQL